MATTKINAVSDSSDLLPDSGVARRYKVTGRTLFRWDRQPELNFPKAVLINGRRYRYVHELETWERSRVA